MQQKLVASGTNGRLADDNFGDTVGISGDTIAVGAYGQNYDDIGGGALTDAGAVYVFTRTAGVWSLQAKLVGSGTNGRLDSDYYGGDVVVSGETLIVGATGQDYDDAGLNLLTSAGAVYVYTRSAGVWTLEKKLVASGTNGRVAGDGFGASIAFSNETLVVAAYSHSYDEAGGNLAAGAGAAFVFTRSGTTWSLQQKLVGSGTNGRIAGDSFGINARISGDTIIVGAESQDYDGAGAK